MESQTPKISVITPTIRPAGLAILRKCLLEQTFTSFEWLVDINYTGKHDLNASYNRLIKRAKGELIVSLQDYIYLLVLVGSNSSKTALKTIPVYMVGSLYDRTY